MTQALQSTAALARWLSVRQGFKPLEQVLDEAPSMQGLFDACLARFDGEDLRVHALLADHGGDPGETAFRAEAFRRGLNECEGEVPGRLRAVVWVLAEREDRAEAFKRALMPFEDGHFLSKTLVGRGVLCTQTGEGAFHGRGGSVPTAAELCAALADPKSDPGEELAKSLEAGRERDAHMLRAEERRAARMLKPGPLPLVWVLIGLNSAAYLMQLYLASGLEAKQSLDPALADRATLLFMGANLREALRQPAELWRLLAHAFLHGGLWHLAMNMAALFSLGSVAERLAGPWRTLAVYLGAAVCGGVLSSLFLPPGTPSVGASGAILGLAGFLMAPRFRRDPRFPKALAQRLYLWLGRPVALTFALGLGLRLFDVPLAFDNAAHLGGLLFGFTLGYLWPSFLVRSALRRA